MLNKRKYAKKNKKQNESKCFMCMNASVSSMRYGSYRMYLEGDSPYQVVMIVYELK